MLLIVLEILVYMIIAAILGVLLGWVLRGVLGSEQTQLSDLRAQLRRMKKRQREKEAVTQAEKGPAPAVSSAPVLEKATQAKAPVAKKKAPAKKLKTKSIKTVARAKPKVAKKASRKVAVRNPSTADRKAEQAAARKSVVEIVKRIGKGESKDDLSKIYGIGPKFAAMLNKMGIKSYAQIAKLRKAEVRTISSAIGVFSDRIERDDWVAGAKKVLKAQK